MDARLYVDRTPKPCQHKQAQHTHGTRLAYVLDKCRCYPCAEAASQYEHTRQRMALYGRGTPTQLTDAEPVREHVRALMAAGLGWKRVADAAGVSRSTLGNMLYGRMRDGRREAPKRRVRRVVADKLLAVGMPTLDDLGGRQLVDATGTRRRLQALSALGWSNVKLAARLGMTPSNYGKTVQSARIYAEHAREVRELYDELSTQLPEPASGYDAAGIARVKAAAERNRWAPPMAWDDDLIDDPRAEPDRGLIRARDFVIDEVAVERVMSGDRELARQLHPRERREVITRLLAQGLNDQEIERRTGISDRTVLRHRHADNERSA